MIVVSDTSPPTALLKIGRPICSAFFSDKSSSRLRSTLSCCTTQPVLPAWLEVRSPPHIPPAVVAACLDPGETQALSLASELHADAVLIDERIGRRAAKSLGLIPTGVLGCLVLANVFPVIAELQDVAGCWFDALAVNLREINAKACGNKVADR